jgi:hypothetical protein
MPKGKPMKVKSIIAALVIGGILLGCASSAVVVGTVRPAISPAQVKLYLNPPKKFEEVALLESSSKASWAVSDQGKMNVVIQRLKEEAAKIGANGVLLRGTGDQNGGTVGTGTYSGNVMVGTGVPIMHKAGSGVAIFVTDE